MAPDETPGAALDGVTQIRAHVYAQERLRAALDGLVGDASDTDVLADAELALAALHLGYGSTTRIVLDPTDLAEVFDMPGPACICPPDLRARGGFRGGCPACNPN